MPDLRTTSSKLSGVNSRTEAVAAAGAGIGLVDGIGGGVLPLTMFNPLPVWLLALLTPLDKADPGGMEGASRGGSLRVGGGFADS